MNSAISGGNITSDGGATVTSRGICWSVSPNPTITDDTTINGNGTGTFSSNLIGLNANTTYYVRSYAVNSAGITYGNEISFTTLNTLIVGQNYQGGIVAFLDNSGMHGLIVSESNVGSLNWGCQGQFLSGAQSLDNGDANTTFINNNCGESPIAAKLCFNLNLNGYSDWYLPAKNQLNTIYTNLHLQGLGNFSGRYWSSTQSASNLAITLNFDSGSFGDSFKNGGALNIRAVRSF
jgi:hypothetical protein